jgi:hypothetical protein
MYGGIQMDQGLGLIISWLVKRFSAFSAFLSAGRQFRACGR